MATPQTILSEHSRNAAIGLYPTEIAGLDTVMGKKRLKTRGDVLRDLVQTSKLPRAIKEQFILPRRKRK